MHLVNSSCCITRKNIAARIRLSHFISVLLSLVSCVQFTPAKGHVSLHSSLKQDCVQASASQVSPHPTFCLQLDAVLSHVRPLQFPPVTRLIADHRSLRTYSCSVSTTVSSIPKCDIQEDHTCSEDKSDDMCHIGHGSPVHIALCKEFLHMIPGYTSYCLVLYHSQLFACRIHLRPPRAISFFQVRACM